MPVGVCFSNVRVLNPSGGVQDLTKGKEQTIVKLEYENSVLKPSSTVSFNRQRSSNLSQSMDRCFRIISLAIDWGVGQKTPFSG